MKVRKGVVETMVSYLVKYEKDKDKVITEVLFCLRCVKVVEKDHADNTGHWNFIVEATAEELKEVQRRWRRRSKEKKTNG